MVTVESWKFTELQNKIRDHLQASDVHDMHFGSKVLIKLRDIKNFFRNLELKQTFHSQLRIVSKPVHSRFRLIVHLKSVCQRHKLSKYSHPVIHLEYSKPGFHTRDP